MTEERRITVVLTETELGLLIDALDSYEYWEHRDELPHDSGNITVLDDDDFEQNVRPNVFDDEAEEVQEAWEAVKASRALEDKLMRLVTPPTL
jgi:hypothetical protein